MNSKKAKAFISSNLKLLSLSIAIGLFACAISIFAFSSPGSNQPPNGNPTFWLLNGASMYYSNGNVGIGTSSPASILTLQASSLDVAHGIRLIGSQGLDALLLYPSADNQETIQAVQDAGQTGSTLLLNPSGGNVGIGTTNPTVQFERACPSGFTNVKAGNNQLGCMETAEEGTATWWVAANTCFTKYGGELPIYTEWYAALNNFSIAVPSNWEWLGNGDYWNQAGTSMAGGGSITNLSTDALTSARGYRCWIPG